MTDFKCYISQVFRRHWTQPVDGGDDEKRAMAICESHLSRKQRRQDVHTVVKKIRVIEPSKVVCRLSGTKSIPSKYSLYAISHIISHEYFTSTILVLVRAAFRPRLLLRKAHGEAKKRRRNLHWRFKKSCQI